jgi:DNA-binding transcriptional LysR family regulator
MDFRHMRYFQAVAEELSYSKAAQRLHIAQPALSRAVKELEDRLGIVLLDRNRRSVALTAAGRVLLNEIGVLLQRFDEAIRKVQRTAAGDEGELRLGFIGPPTQNFLGRVLQEFRRRHPRVSVVLEERTPERVWEMVVRGRLDIGLTRPVLASRALGLKTALLRKERLCAAFPTNHPLARSASVRWRDLTDEPLIILARREGVGLHDAALDACRQARFNPKLAHTPSLVSTVLSYVEAGAGVGIIPDSVSSLGAGLPVVFRPLTPAHTVELVMVWSDEVESPPAAAFRSLMQEWLKAGSLWKPGS